MIANGFHYLCAEKENGPKTINDMKLINAGKVLENNKTLAESRVPVGELPGGVITMHVVVRPPSSDKASGKPAKLGTRRCSVRFSCIVWLSVTSI